MPNFYQATFKYDELQRRRVLMFSITSTDIMLVVYDNDDNITIMCGDEQDIKSKLIDGQKDFLQR